MNPKIILGLAMLFLFLLSAGVTYALLHNSLDKPEHQAEEVDESDVKDAKILKKDRINLLLIALDARPGEVEGRTDSLIFASLDRQNNSISLMSIPRDTRVSISGRGQDKINNAHFYGGVPLVQKTVEDLLGVSIDYYVKTNFEGFRDIVDTLGGVEIDVERRMYYYQGDPYDRIDLQKGLQRLNGDKALQYVRFRSDALGDISRTQRQQNFLQAFAKETLQMNNLWKIPTLIPQMSKAVETNLGVSDMLALAFTARDWNSLEIFSHTLPGNFLDLNGVSYWQVDPTVAKKATKDLLLGEVNTDIVEGRTIVLNDRPVQKAPQKEDLEDDEINQDQSKDLKEELRAGEKESQEKKNDSRTEATPTKPSNPTAPTSPMTPPLRPSTSTPSTPEKPQTQEPTQPKNDKPSLDFNEGPTKPSQDINEGAPPVPSGVEPLHPATPIENSVQFGGSSMDENI
ncbi:LytR family transcriptional regulator [Heliorestis acidaminivorans]|uniref:LytR family transcriptional regulator n=2 Tax=Heliorestis acidaminivorans TaxID=553427 RepID=A0A6I0F594_9FIRM|nr:LytR family transcriptional regulator [Heliorestis acidaminivorans]